MSGDKSSMRVVPLKPAAKAQAVQAPPPDAAAPKRSAGGPHRSHGEHEAVGNLAGLAIVQSLRLRQDGGIDILVDPARVKNRVPLVAELTGGSAALVRRYIKDYRPLLGDAAAPWLFPGKQPGIAKTTDGLRQQITRAMAEIAGVEWHVHAFRHLLAKIQLDAQPGSDGIVTRALGHKRADTARQHYSGYATAAAIRHYDELLLARRATLLRPRRGRR